MTLRLDSRAPPEQASPAAWLRGLFVKNVVLVVLALSGAAWAQSVDGQWRGETGVLSLKQKGASFSGTLSEEGISGKVSGSVSGGKLKGSLNLLGETGTFTGTVSKDSITLVFDDDPEPEVFRRAGGKAPAVAADDGDEAEPGARAMPMRGEADQGMRMGKRPPERREEAPAAPATGAASGAEYKSDAEGWAVRSPKNWFYKENGARLLFGSNTEAGLIIAWYAEGSTYAETRQVAQQGITVGDIQLTPTSQPQELKVGGNRAVSVELSGTYQGTPVQARAVGVVGPRGTVGVLGLTTPEKFKALRPRVDELAKSARFFAPKVGAGAHLIRGVLCSHSGGSIASWSRRLSFDGKGRVSSGSEMVAGGQFNDQYGNNTGAWGAGSNSSGGGGTYSVQGNQVVLRLNGEVRTCTVNFRQGNGAITELMCDGKLYGAPLCD